MSKMGREFLRTADERAEQDAQMVSYLESIIEDVRPILMELAMWPCTCPASPLRPECLSCRAEIVRERYGLDGRRS